MDVVFEIKDKTGRKIHLSKERWSHIRQRHPNAGNIEEIEETLRNPLKIIEIEEDFVSYYKYFKRIKESAKYLHNLRIRFLTFKCNEKSINIGYL